LAHTNIESEQLYDRQSVFKAYRDTTAGLAGILISTSGIKQVNRFYNT
jgi:hypothetical protein